jgi:hypothetical protein
MGVKVAVNQRWKMERYQKCPKTERCSHRPNQKGKVIAKVFENAKLHA